METKLSTLSTENEFAVRCFEIAAQALSREEAQAMLVQLYQQMLVQETLYKQLLKQEWGICNDH